MNSTLKSLVFWVVLVLVGGLVWNFSTRFQTAQKPETFSEFMSKVDAGQVARVTITGNEITYSAKNGEGFRTYAPAQYEGLANKLLERNVAVAAREPTTSPWAALLYSWAPILLMIGFWVFFMRQMQSGGNKALSFGKSKAKLSSTSQKKVTFKDVAGADEAKEELQEIIEFLREPQKFQKLGGRIPKGVLLIGSPGTGKTLWVQEPFPEQGPAGLRGTSARGVTYWAEGNDRRIFVVRRDLRRRDGRLHFFGIIGEVGLRGLEAGHGADAVAQQHQLATRGCRQVFDQMLDRGPHAVAAGLPGDQREAAAVLGVGGDQADDGHLSAPSPDRGS